MRYGQGYYNSDARYDSPDEPPPTNPQPTHTMIRFDRFFINPFDDDGISLDELSAYTVDNLQRMINNNPGAFLNARINATTVAFTTLESCVDSDQAKLGLRKARVMLKDTFRAGLSKQITKIHAAIVAEYGAASAVELEAFPYGRKIFQDSTDEHLNNHFNTLVTALTPHVAQMGPDALADAGGLQSNWTGLYAASTSATGVKNATVEGKKAARKALQHELFLTLLFIASAFPGQPEKAALYMRQSLLEDHPAAEPEPEPPAPPPPTP